MPSPAVAAVPTGRFLCSGHLGYGSVDEREYVRALRGQQQMQFVGKTDRREINVVVILQIREKEFVSVITQDFTHIQSPIGLPPPNRFKYRPGGLHGFYADAWKIPAQHLDNGPTFRHCDSGFRHLPDMRNLVAPGSCHKGIG